MIIDNKLAENKLLILYILSFYKKAVSSVEISDIAIANDILSYFTLLKYLKELERDKYVVFSDSSGNLYINISTLGIEVLNFFIKRLDANKTSNIKNYIEKKIDYGNSQSI
ncbi:MAG: DUF4364 family protein [Oscillospiraceae bacterium]|nr:DUF4364 family protein [Oscillospiraceae bacterium]